MNKKGIMVVNIILLLCISYAFYYRFHKTQVIIDTNRETEPRELLEVIDSNNLRFNNNFKVIFIFKRKPTFAHLEDIDKLHNIYKNVDLCAIFLNRFRLGKTTFQFPYRFLTRYNFIFINSNDRLNYSNCVLVVKGARIAFVDDVFKIDRLSKVLSWQENSGSSVSETKLSRENFISILNDRLANRDVRLMDIYTRDSYSLASLIRSGKEKLCIIHSACTDCELRKLLSNLVEIQLNNDILIIFSVRSNSYELLSLLNLWNVHLNAYIDYYDTLDLLGIETNDKYSLITLDWRGTI